MMPYRVIFVIILTIVTASINAEVKKEIRALKTSGTIIIDGYLDEGDWSETQVIDDFIQQYPNEGLPLSERTEVRLLYDTDKSMRWEAIIIVMVELTYFYDLTTCGGYAL